MFVQSRLLLAASLVCANVLAATPQLPPPDPEHSVSNRSKVVGWEGEATPKAPAGFTVTRYASDFLTPRWLYVTPNGDVLVAEAAIGGSWLKSALKGKNGGRITLLRDKDGDGKPEQREVFLEGLNRPLGMQVIGDWFYVANTDGVWRFPYQPGDLKIHGQGEKILELPAGGYNNHWTRNLLANANNNKLYISVGSASNNGEHGLDEEERRANILEVNPDGTEERIYASGLRNPVGMAWAPGTQTLWTVVNERDNLGDELVPDYLTSVKKDGFYGWPFAYFGQHEDPRMAGVRPDLVKQSLVPDVALGAHTASLGLAFYTQDAFPQKYRGGAFIGQHGSWNRSELAGYKVVFVPFENGRPSGAPEDFLTGFIANADDSKVHGRPVGVAVAPDGALLVVDDASSAIWRVQVAR
jgi:glucose/arabinose dehydrogenase